MDSNQSDRVTAFDTLFTTGHIQMLKLLLGYMEPSVQGRLAVYIKFMELQYTLQFVQNHPFAAMPLSQNLNHSGGGMGVLLDEMIPFCSANEKEKLQNIKNAIKNFENMQEMMQVLEMMQEISPELFSGNSGMPGFGADFNNADLTQMMEMMQEMFKNN